MKTTLLGCVHVPLQLQEHKTYPCGERYPDSNYWHFFPPPPPSSPPPIPGSAHLLLMCVRSFKFRIQQNEIDSYFLFGFSKKKPDPSGNSRFGTPTFWRMYVWSFKFRIQQNEIDSYFVFCFSKKIPDIFEWQKWKWLCYTPGRDFTARNYIKWATG